MIGGTRSSHNVRAGVRSHNAIMRVFRFLLLPFVLAGSWQLVGRPLFCFCSGFCCCRFGWKLVAGNSAFALLLFLLLLLSRLEAGSWQLVASWMLPLPFAVS